MAVSHVELYEALEPSIGEEAAAMIAEVIPPARDLATKLDIESLRTEMHQLNNQTLRWMLGLAIPTWVGTLSAVLAVLLKG